MNKEILPFIIFLIHHIANRYGVSPSVVYHKLETCDCIKKYIIPYYDSLHTQGEDYLINDIEIYLKNRGVSIL